LWKSSKNVSTGHAASGRAGVLPTGLVIALSTAS
jgi:hypothetical protein